MKASDFSPFHSRWCLALLGLCAFYACANGETSPQAASSSSQAHPSVALINCAKGAVGQTLMHAERSIVATEIKSIPLRKTVVQNRVRSVLHDRAIHIGGELVSAYMQVVEDPPIEEQYVGVIVKELSLSVTRATTCEPAQMAADGSVTVRGELDTEAWKRDFMADKEVPYAFREFFAQHVEEAMQGDCAQPFVDRQIK
jgi:hypothetical protein